PCSTSLPYTTLFRSILMRITENVFNPEAPAVEEFCDEFRDWVHMPEHYETFQNLQYVASALRRSPARSYINERFVGLQYLLSQQDRKSTRLNSSHVK